MEIFKTCKSVGAGCNPFIQVLSEKFVEARMDARRLLVVIPLFRSYRKNETTGWMFGILFACCNPFIQVLSEKFNEIIRDVQYLCFVVIPLFRSYRKNI